MRNDEKTVLDSVKQILAETEGATAGPWSWRGQGGSDEMPKGAYLRSDTPGTPRYIVMDFIRQGMHGAQPRLRVKPRSHSIMQPISEIGGTWRQHPDAALMAAAPDMRALLERIGSLLAQLHPLAVTASSSTGTAAQVRAARDELVRVCLELGGEA